MELLAEHQKDALSELINIAFGRTAASLSELTGQRVALEPPRIAVQPIAELYDTVVGLVSEQVATVHQIFMGPVAGDAFLMLDYEGAVQLVELLTDSPALAGRLDASAREVLAEVGNILLNACLGMFGNLLQVHISFSVPRLRLEDLHSLVESLIVGQEELRYALVISTTFRLLQSQVSGYLVIVLGVTSLDRLLHAVGEWERQQIGQ